MLLRNAKPNNGRFRNRAPKVSISIKLAAVQASGAACMKLHEIQCHFREVPHWITGYGLRPRRRPRARPSPLKNSDFEDEHEDDDEKNPNILHSYAPVGAG